VLSCWRERIQPFDESGGVALNTGTRPALGGVPGARSLIRKVNEEGWYHRREEYHGTASTSQVASGLGPEDFLFQFADYPMNVVESGLRKSGKCRPVVRCFVARFAEQPGWVGGGT
jgi:hypothetical protein